MAQEFLIKTARLSLRPLRGADRDVVVDLINDYDISRWLTVVPYPYGAADFDAFLAYLADKPAHENLAIIADGQPVGMIGIDASLGYWLGHAHQGHGYMTEAATALIDWYFATTDAEHLRAGHFDDNAASRAVLTRLGFLPEGEGMVSSIAQGRDVLMKNTRLSRADWDAQQAPARR